MGLWTRVRNVFRGDAVNSEIEEEFASHVDEAVAEGRDPREARRALGFANRAREASHEARVVGWMDSLRADIIFGWRQLTKRKVTTAAAVLSLGLAIGSCTAAFRLIDAMFLRPMPVSDPASLYVLQYNRLDPKTGEPITFTSNSYPMFRLMRDTVRERADVLAVSQPVQQMDLTYGSVQEMEKAYQESVSGDLFTNFGLQPAVGRLLTADDDRQPGKNPYAVLSYDYWKRRFGSDPGVVGRTFHQDTTIWQIVGVAPKSFTGTETGKMVDIFTPVTMNAGEINRDSDFWLSIFVRVKPGVSVLTLQQQLETIYRTAEKERAKGFKNSPKYLMDKYPTETLSLKPAAGGASALQRQYRTALTALSVLVFMVLLIACANVANLMSAQAASRAREMALRVSLGAGRWRLVCMVLIESAMLGLMAAIVGLAFAWWAAPLVVNRINPPDNPAMLVLPLDWPVLAFGFAMAVSVTLLFGLLPALRASSVKPVNALKGGEEPHAKRRTMYGLIAAQVAFCFVVLFIAGLFAQTFARLTKLQTGFSPEHLLLLDVVAQHSQPAVKWDQLAATLHDVPGVQATALESWAMMSGTQHNDSIVMNGSAPGQTNAYFMNVSPGWLDAMRISLLAGRDLRDDDTAPGTAIVNETFAKTYNNGANPVGSFFIVKPPNGPDVRYEIVGLARDVMYRELRERMLPQAYIPIHRIAAAPAGTAPVEGSPVMLRTMGESMIVVRTTTNNPVELTETLRRAVAQADPEFRVSEIRTQTGLIDAQTIRERLLASLALFFASVALLLAAIGLYGVLSYSVVQREREIGIRIALGAAAANIARIVTGRVMLMVLAGAAVGLAAGMASAKYVTSLLYGVKATDASMMALPGAVLLAAAVFAAAPAVWRAVRIDPAQMLRAE